MRYCIFAFDFSMNKPAMCSYINGKIQFYIWPLNIDEYSENALQKADVIVYNRNLEAIKEKSLNEHKLICEHVRRSVSLANLIHNTISNELSKNNIKPENAVIVNEGRSFGSKGDAALDLSGYKYILMNVLMENGFIDFKTYSPMAIKATAKCSGRGKKKEDMINALREENQDNHNFIKTLANNPQQFKKKTAYIQGIDDLTDAYWNLKTYLRKENIQLPEIS